MVRLGAAHDGTCQYTSTCIYMYIYVDTYVYVYTYTYISVVVGLNFCLQHGGNYEQTYYDFNNRDPP